MDTATTHSSLGVTDLIDEYENNVNYLIIIRSKPHKSPPYGFGLDT